MENIKLEKDQYSEFFCNKFINTLLKGESECNLGKYELKDIRKFL